MWVIIVLFVIFGAFFVFELYRFADDLKRRKKKEKSKKVSSTDVVDNNGKEVK